MKNNINALHKRIQDCKECIDLEPWSKFPSNAHGKKDSKVVILSEAPGQLSVNNGRMWFGGGGSRLRNIFLEIQLDLEDIFYITDIIKCLPPRNRKPKKNEIDNCSEHLVHEVKYLNPKLILCFGKTASKFVYSKFTMKSGIHFNKITEVHSDKGYIIQNFENFDAIFLLHPSNANRFMDYTKYKSHLREIYCQKIKPLKSTFPK